jgi:ABC-type multidrug transport system ATPase subunit
VKLGFLPERPYFYEYLTGKEFLALHWELRGFKCNAAFNQRVDEVLTEVNLMRGKDLKLRQYSKGMLQRIGIAQAIIHRPEFLILDEPMSGLDPDGRYLVKQIIKNLHRLGTTIFFSSHLLQDMEELCDRLVIIDQGRIIYEGSLTTLWSKHSEQFQIDFQETSEGPRQTWSGPQGEVQKQIDELRERKAHILRVFEKRISLEEAFVSLRKIGG